MSDRDRKLLESWQAAINRIHFGSGTFGDCRVYSARGGQSMDDAAVAMIDCANALGKPVLCSFNGTPMIANSGDAPGAVVAQWCYWRHEEDTR